jgi:hypothetical protein
VQIAIGREHITEERDMPDEKDHAQNRCDGLRKTFPLGHYAHYKGGDYIVYGLSIKEDTLAIQVHYYSISKKTQWTRDWDEFNSTLDIAAGRVLRFKFERHATIPELLMAAGFGTFIEQFKSIATNFSIMSDLFRDFRLLKF